MLCTKSIEKVIYSRNIRFRRKSSYFYGCSFSLEVPTEVDAEDTIEEHIGVTDKPEGIK